MYTSPVQTTTTQRVRQENTMTLNEIKSAVDEGKIVCWKNPMYVVRKNGEFYDIECTSNGSATGLTWTDGVTMEAKEADFFVACVVSDSTDGTHKVLNRYGLAMLIQEIDSNVKDESGVTDEELDRMIETCEQEGGCEIKARLTTSGRPEIISADDSWFDVIVDQETIDQTQPVLCRHIDGAQLRNATEDELGDSIERGDDYIIQVEINGEIVDCFVQD